MSLLQSSLVLPTMVPVQSPGVDYKSGFLSFIAWVHLLLSAHHGGTWQSPQRIPSLIAC